MTQRQRRHSGRGACGKRDFITRALAEAQLERCRRAAANGNATRQERRVYYCTQCLGWHLTHHRAGVKIAISGSLLRRRFQ